MDDKEWRELKENVDLSQIKESEREIKIECQSESERKSGCPTTDE